MQKNRSVGLYGDLSPIQVRCPECGHRTFEAAKGRFGPIWRCGSPDGCAFWVTSRPTGKKCRQRMRGKLCGALMVEGTKTIPNRCSRKECANRHPT